MTNDAVEAIEQLAPALGWTVHWRDGRPHGVTLAKGPMQMHFASAVEALGHMGALASHEPNAEQLRAAVGWVGTTAVPGGNAMKERGLAWLSGD